MRQYSRADGIQCLAIKFEENGESNPAHVFELLTILNDAELSAVHVKEEATDEWFENEDGEPEERIIGEHIKTQANEDQLFIGDYIVKRDGDTYIMDGPLFESMWTESITEDIDEWEWVLNERLPYAKKAGFWRHKREPDVVSMDGGLCYFRRSETPLYQPHGQLYKSAVPIGVKA